MTAYLLQKQLETPYEITIYEMRPRVGGKIITRQFGLKGTTYEAGAAELYDYSKVGPDPLRELVKELGLTILPMGGRAVIINNRIIRSPKDIPRELGDHATEALRHFHRQARRAISPWDYYSCDWSEKSNGRLISEGFKSYLSRIGDARAQHYVEVLIHSDMATEAEHTNALYGLQNYLMNFEDYMRLYSIAGGIEQLPKELTKRLTARILLAQRVVRVEPKLHHGYRVFSRKERAIVSQDFDFVIVALPVNWLMSVDWAGSLAEPMRRHHACYDDLAHYLRVTVLFRKPFWRDKIAESYFMLDAFGGCCVYDESSRNVEKSPYGVLSWLLAGEPALSMSNFDDDLLIKRVVESLPPCLNYRPEWFVEGRVYRFIGTVSALPGGHHPKEPESRHSPDAHHPHFFIVGDYLFDSTINGVLDSATIVADLVTEGIEELSGVETAANLVLDGIGANGNGNAPLELNATGNRAALLSADAAESINLDATQNPEEVRPEVPVQL